MNTGISEKLPFKSLKEYEEYTYRYRMIRGFYWHDTAIMLKTAADKILAAHIDACNHYLNSWNSRDGKPITDEDILLRRDRELFPVYMLLMGYALENLIKGIIICIYRTIINLFFIDKFLNIFLGILKICIIKFTIPLINFTGLTII
jgi:hypothetical protein